VLTDDQRNELMNAGVVPFVTDDEYCKYCSAKLQSGLRGVEGIIHTL
jgi:hypothetical protein